MRIAVVEDDDGVGEALVDALGRAGHAPVRMRRGSELLLGHRDVEAVVLDLGLPDADGLAVLRRLRAVDDVPVVVLTARGDERSVVRALRAGADAHLVEPARLRELQARLEVAVRRRGSAGAETATVVRAGEVVVDLTARRATVHGADVALTRTEFEVLAHLVRRRGEAVSRLELMDAIWGDAYVTASRSLDVHMTALRAKLAVPDAIVTVRGFGYRWAR